MRLKKKLVPGGILEVASGTAFLFFSTNGNSSDFPADGFDEWWKERQTALPYAKRLAVNLDNGPDCSAHRTQFLTPQAWKFSWLTILHIIASTIQLNAIGEILER